MLNWTHNSKDILSHDDLTSDVVGFIYCIKYKDGRRYIGKKLIRSARRVKPTKAQLAIRKNYKRVEMVDLPFVNYEGSTKNSVGLEVQNKIILELCSDKINLDYCERKWLIHYDVLNSDKYLNDNIGGTYFRGKITKGMTPKEMEYILSKGE